MHIGLQPGCTGLEAREACHVAVHVGERQPALVHHVGVAWPAVETHLVTRLHGDGVLVVDVRGVTVAVGVDEVLEAVSGKPVSRWVGSR